MCKKPGHLERNCWSQQKACGRKTDEANQSKVDSAKAKPVQNVFGGPLAWITGKVEPTSWFVDSGASRNMTGRSGFFDVLQESKGISVMLADDEKAVVEGNGSGR